MPAITKPELLKLSERLVGQQCVLRPYRSGDGSAVFHAVDRSRADLKHWVTWVDEYPLEEDWERYVRRMAAQWSTRESLAFGIWSSDETELYGGVGIHGINWTVPSGEVGYFLHADARGKGIAAEALRLVVELGFLEIGMNRLWATCDVINQGSWHLLDRVGFKREGHLRGERRNPQGGIRDTFVYGMLAREWQNTHSTSV